MLTSLQARHFKSWRDTGSVRIAPITGFFGTNSSGKTAILQLLLLLKQTAESTDRAHVLQLGDDRSYVNLGTFYDIIFEHQLPGTLEFELSWTLPAVLKIADPEGRPNRPLFALNALTFSAAIDGDEAGLSVGGFRFHLAAGDRVAHFGMQRKNGSNGDKSKQYDLRAEGYAPDAHPAGHGPYLRRSNSMGSPIRSAVTIKTWASLRCLHWRWKRPWPVSTILVRCVNTHIAAMCGPESSRTMSGRRGELAVPALLAAR